MPESGSLIRELLGKNVLRNVFGLGYRFVAPVDGDGSGHTPNTNLPSIEQELIGRESDLARLGTLLSEPGLITVIGLPGVGKTSLARLTGAPPFSAFPDGVWYLEASGFQSVDPLAARSAGWSAFGEERLRTFRLISPAPLPQSGCFWCSTAANRCDPSSCRFARGVSISPVPTPSPVPAWAKAVSSSAGAGSSTTRWLPPKSAGRGGIAYSIRSAPTSQAGSPRRHFPTTIASPPSTPSPSFGKPIRIGIAPRSLNGSGTWLTNSTDFGAP